MATEENGFYEKPAYPKGYASGIAKEIWDAVFDEENSQLMPTQDTLLVRTYIDNVKDIIRMRAHLKKHGDRLYINDGKTLIIDPYVKQINELTKFNLSILSSLGFSPLGRAKLKMFSEAAPDDVVDFAKEGI